MTRAYFTCLTLAVTLVAFTFADVALDAGAPEPTPQAGRGGGPVTSPEVSADGRVTFRLRAPNAHEVAVAVGGNRLPMQKDDQGVWSVTSDPMTPDVYTYALDVDGASMNDPANRQVQTSFGRFQSMFVVPGPAAWLPANVPHGAIARHTFHSTVAGDDRDFFVYTPPRYDPRRQAPYPVLYLLHGLGDDAERWMTGGGGAHNVLDNLIAQGTAVPMIMVTPLGYGTSTGPAGGRRPENITGLSAVLLDELMPIVDQAYHVSRSREDRAIAGLSMGGAESLYVGLNHLDRFAWIGAYSTAARLWPAAAEAAAAAPPASGGASRTGPPAPMDPAHFAATFPVLSAGDNARIRMLWIVCGTDDGLIGQNRQFKDWLRSKNVLFTEQEVPGMAHVWPLWRQNLTDMVPRLFQGPGR